MHEFKKRLILIKGIKYIHDLHVWEYTQGKLMMTCHVEIDDKLPYDKVLKKATILCRKFNILHSTI